MIRRRYRRDGLREGRGGWPPEIGRRERAGVARSGFYFYFDSKYAVLAHILGEVTHELEELTHDFAPRGDGGSPITNYEYSTDNGSTWTPLSPAQTTQSAQMMQAAQTMQTMQTKPPMQPMRLMQPWQHQHEH